VKALCLATDMGHHCLVDREACLTRAMRPRRAQSRRCAQVNDSGQRLVVRECVPVRLPTHHSALQLKSKTSAPAVSRHHQALSPLAVVASMSITKRATRRWHCSGERRGGVRAHVRGARLALFLVSSISAPIRTFFAMP